MAPVARNPDWRGQVVVVNAFYTGCRASLPQTMGTLSQLAGQTGD